eukprot:COSAG02_NODE_1759_length_11042_cov_3.648725_8_plen_194_part_00
MSFQAGQGRSYKYLKPSVKPLFEFASGASYTTFQMQAHDETPLKLGPAPKNVCVAITNTGSRKSPVVITLFSSTTRSELESSNAMARSAVAHESTDTAPRLIPNRQLIAFEKVHTTPQQTQTVCMELRDEDLAMVDDAGSHVAYAGQYTLTFFDGVSKATVAATIETKRTVATIPAVDNPQPPCCMGSQTSCC